MLNSKIAKPCWVLILLVSTCHAAQKEAPPTASSSPTFAETSNFIQEKLRDFPAPESASEPMTIGVYFAHADLKASVGRTGQTLSIDEVTGMLTVTYREVLSVSYHNIQHPEWGSPTGTQGVDVMFVAPLNNLKLTVHRGGAGPNEVTLDFALVGFRCADQTKCIRYDVQLTECSNAQFQSLFNVNSRDEDWTYFHAFCDRPWSVDESGSSKNSAGDVRMSKEHPEQIEKVARAFAHLIDLAQKRHPKAKELF